MTKDVGLFVQPTTALQDILKKRLERGDKVKEGVLYRKNG